MVVRSQIFFQVDFAQQHSPFFEICFVIEILISLFMLAVIPFLIREIFKQRKIHRNIRLMASHIWLRYGSAIVGRLVLIYYQVNRICWTDADVLFTIANLTRGSFTGYLTSFMCSIAFERLIATLLWNWYEKQASSTISIAVISLSMVEIFGQFAAYLYAYEVLTIQQHYFLLFSYACGSTAIREFEVTDRLHFPHSLVHLTGERCIYCVFLLNNKIMKELKEGARIDSYSINRTYQIKENLKVIKELIRFVGPTVFFNIPCFLFYGLYAFLPQSMYTIRIFGAEFYDICSVLYGLGYVIIMVLMRDRISFWNNLMLKYDRKRQAEAKVTSDSDIYFTQLNAQFQ